MPYQSLPSGAGICLTCRRPVLWTVTTAGRRQAVDPLPHPDGRVAVYQDTAGRWRSRQLSKDRPTTEAAEVLYMAHAATCTRPRPRQTRIPTTRLPTPRRTPWPRRS